MGFGRTITKSYDVENAQGFRVTFSAKAVGSLDRTSFTGFAYPQSKK
jgi:hypothetical protein